MSRLHEPIRWFHLSPLRTYLFVISLVQVFGVTGILATLTAHVPPWQLGSMGVLSVAAVLIPAMVLHQALEPCLEPPSGGQALDSQQQFLQNVIDSIPSMIVVKDRRDRIQVANQASATLHGLTPTEMVGRQDREINPHLSLAEAERLEQISQRVMATQIPYQLEQILTDAKGDDRWYQLLISPFKDEHGRVIGVINNGIDITERKGVETALQEANQNLEQLATHDGLTRIPNRRCFDQYLQREWQRMTREHQPLSLILLDVDFFKAYNDYFGHQQGDEGLAAIAQAIQQAVKRSVDLLARYGGEEFGVILPNTRRTGAENVAQAIQSEIKALGLPHPKSRVNDYLTVSMGIASAVPTPNQSVEELIAAANSALYQAKRRGRDRYWIRLI